MTGARTRDRGRGAVLWQLLRDRWPTIAVLALYALGSWWLFAPMGLADPNRLPGCACGDVAQQVWLLEWAKVSAAHGHLSWHSSLMDFPSGINLADSASFPLLAVAAAPLTAVVGPVAALGVLFRVAVWATAAAGYGLARRFGLGAVAAALAGATCGFGPAMVHQAGVHVFLVFLPLLFGCIAVVHAQWTQEPGRWRLRGVLFGLLICGQLLIDPELLLGAMVIGSGVCVLLVVGKARAGRATRRRWLGRLCDHPRALMAMVVTAGVTAAPALAALAWGSLVSPDHLRGPSQAVSGSGVSLLSFVSRRPPALVGSHHAVVIDALRIQNGTAFLGVPVCVMALAVVVTYRRDRLVVGAGLTAVVAGVLALGPHLVVTDTTTSIPLPFDLLTQIPVLQDIIPSRLTLLLDPAVGLILARGLDLQIRALTLWRSRRREAHTYSLSPRPTVAYALVGVVAVLVAAVTVGPRHSVATGVVGTGQLFASSTLQRDLPSGGTVLAAAPFPSYPDDQPLIWQAEDRMRFSLLGGYGNRPGSRGTVSGPILDSPSIVPQVLLDARWSPIRASALRCAQQLLPRFVARWHVRAIIVAPRTPGASVANAMASADYGRPSIRKPFRIWRGAQLRHPHAPRWSRRSCGRAARLQ